MKRTNSEHKKKGKKIKFNLGKDNSSGGKKSGSISSKPLKSALKKKEK